MAREMNIERMREGLRIIYEECNGNCRECPFVQGCYMSDGLCTYIGEVAEYILDYGPGGRFHTPKEDAENVCKDEEHFPEWCGVRKMDGENE